MDLTTRYLGLTLAHPFMPGASPLVDDLEFVRELEDAGAAAIVMRSLFEEQIVWQRIGRDAIAPLQSDADPETQSFFPSAAEFALGPDRYLERLRRIKRRVDIPVIGSLNGTTPEGWLDYSKRIEQAGADALELNFYHVATDPSQDGAAVEQSLLDIAAVVKESVGIPVSVKLSPFYSSLPHLASKLDALGVDGLVLFNRFFEPDIDPEEVEAVPRLELSDGSELPLRLQWLAILAGHFRGSMAVSGGVLDAVGAVKAVMAGADAVQMVSALLRKGPHHLRHVIRAFREWGDDRGYTSIDQIRDRMSLKHCADPAAFERGGYLRILQSWHPPEPGEARRKLRHGR